jgi:hypothetical protein
MSTSHSHDNSCVVREREEKKCWPIRTFLFSLSGRVFFFYCWTDKRIKETSWGREKLKRRIERERAIMCKQATHKRVDYKRMNRSIRDMSNLCDDITSPSHTHVMFNKTNFFFSFLLLWSSMNSLSSFGDILAVNRKRFFFFFFRYMLLLQKYH